MMKQILLTALLGIILMMPTLSVYAGEKDDAHIAYIFKNMKLSGDEKAKVKPILQAYYKEVSAAKAANKALKDKYDMAEDAGKLSAAQCDELFESKQKAERAELDIRKNYYPKFKAVLPVMKAYQLMKLANDKVK
jgi:Skp family chaperone for outer membrane proteins